MGKGVGRMKLSKKIVAAILTVAMVVTQVSVFTFASGEYASGKNDDAYYALKVPDVSYVGYGSSLQDTAGWVQSNNTIGKGSSPTEFASDLKGNIYITTVDGERFFEISTSTGLRASHAVTFRNAPANTYTSESSTLVNGIPGVLNPSTLTGMMFRIKGLGSSTDTLPLDIILTKGTGATTAYTAMNGIKFIDFTTGAVTDITYSTTSGIQLPGNANGYIYVALSGFENGSTNLGQESAMTSFAENATEYKATNKGYKGIKFMFKSDSFKGKTLLIGDAFFTKSYDTIVEVHTSPEAPSLLEATETEIKVNTVAGVEYSIDKNDWNTTGVFTGLTEGTVYTVYARYSAKSLRYASVMLATTGLSAPILNSADYTSIKVNVVEGQEYSLDKETWNTTGEFTGLTAGTSYTVYTRIAGDDSEYKSSEFSTLSYPWSSGNQDGAYEALTIGLYTTIPSTHATLSESVGNNGALEITEIDGKKYITVTSKDGVEGSAGINAALITYNKNMGLPDDMLDSANFKGLALRLKITGNDNRALTAFDVAIGDYAAIDGDYIFIDANTGAQTILTRDLGFTVTDNIDGWLMLPFEFMRKPIEGSSPVPMVAGNLTVYKNINITLHGLDCVHGVRADWSDVAINIGDSLFYTNSDLFVKAHGVPAVEVASKTNDTIVIKVEDGVEYSIDGENWQTTPTFKSLKTNTTYTINAKYIGASAMNSVKIKTRAISVALKDPVFDYATTDSIVLKAQPDHEYTIDGGETWVESGVFTGLADGKEYEIYARVVGKDVLSKVLVAKTVGSVYSTNNSDSANYFFRVPNKAEDGAELPTNSAGRAYLSSTLLDSNFTEAFGRKAEGGAYADYENGGVIFVETIDGESFVELKKNGSDSASYKISSNAYYNGKQYYNGKAGYPASIDGDKVEGLAIRVAALGGAEGAVTGMDFKLKRSSAYTSFPILATEIQYFDSETGDITLLSRTTSIQVNKELNGWIVLPFSAFWKNVEGTVADLIENFEGIEVSVVGDWGDRTLYIGDSVIVYDLNNFMAANADPNAPELIEKSYKSLTVNAVSGFEYSIDKENWNTTGEFTNLNENTAYTVYARRIGRVHMSESVFTTDYENPPLDMPTLKEVGYHEIRVETIGGLEYSIDGSTWTESGVFTELDPRTTYTVIGRNKSNHSQTPALEVTTLTYDNPYDRGDGSSTFMTISKYEATGKYNEYYFSSTGIDADGNQAGQGTAGGYVPVINEDGELFLDFCRQNEDVATDKGTFFLSSRLTYNMPLQGGFPNCIWISQFWGIATRVKIDENETNPFLTFFVNVRDEKGVRSEKALTSSYTYYVIDYETQTWEKRQADGQKMYVTGLDGWIMIPFTEIEKLGYTRADLQLGFEQFMFYLNFGSVVGNTTTSWVGTHFRAGDTVVIEDVNTFTKTYAPMSKTTIANQPHNLVTDTSVPAVMVNDCEGSEIGDGLYDIEGARAWNNVFVKPNETTNGLVIDPGENLSYVQFTYDALNYKEIDQDHYDQVMWSIGVSFNIKVPKAFEDSITFTVETREGPEIFQYGNSYYFTVVDGKAYKHYGKIQLKAGFDGTLIIPFNNFAYDSINSTEFVDGSVFSPDIIDYFGFTFDTVECPALSRGSIMVDDVMIYQDEQEFITYMLQVQGTKEYSIIDLVQTFTLDDYPEFPRTMANDCTGIEVGKGIFAMTGVTLKYIEATDSQNGHVQVEIGKGMSNVQFKNYADLDSLTDEEYEQLINQGGVSFHISVPENAPMIVGLDFEVREDETEYFLYDANTYYYTVVGDDIYQAFGYLEFYPGFEGTVIVPFENFYFDEVYSEMWDGELVDIDLIDYFGFYFNTSDYVSIGGTKIEIDDIAFYRNAFDYIDAIWCEETGNERTYIDYMNSDDEYSDEEYSDELYSDEAYYSVNATVATETLDVDTVGAASSDNTVPVMVVVGLAVVSAGLIVISRKKKETQE